MRDSAARTGLFERKDVQYGRSQGRLSPTPLPPAHATTPPRNQILYQSASDLPVLGQVTQWINDHRTYTNAARQTFLGCSDLMVVAQALAGKHTMITHEKAENSIHRVKIPNVCVGLNVKYTTPWQMLRAERARFVLEQLSRSRGLG